jgi:L-fuconate dehydratase
VSTITSIEVEDVRFPTSITLDGSDAVNVDPDYSAAYVTILTSAGETGRAFVFTLGRGNEIVISAISSYGGLLLGRDVTALLADMGGTSRRLVHDSQLRWLGPEKGVAHMACGALINALWDIRARRAGKPLWLLLSELSADELVSVIDFTHIADALTEDEATSILRQGEQGKVERIERLRVDGYPAYTTSPGWLGYSDDKLLRLSREAVEAGFEMVKLKVGASLRDDRRRLSLLRSQLPDLKVAIDANQAWNVGQAVEWISQLAEFDPYWVEEPTSTDDVLGHASIKKMVSPIRIATGEAVANRIIFKQLLQLDAIDFLQLDASRVGGVNENLAILLLAAKFDVPVCPHAGGVGLCELAQHFAYFDFAAVSASTDGRYFEYVDHLHEHFVDPVRVVGGRYLPPSSPGIGSEMHAGPREWWRYPDGPAWMRPHNSPTNVIETS